MHFLFFFLSFFLANDNNNNRYGGVSLYCFSQISGHHWTIHCVLLLTSLSICSTIIILYYYYYYYMCDNLVPTLNSGEMNVNSIRQFECVAVCSRRQLIPWLFDSQFVNLAIAIKIECWVCCFARLALIESFTCPVLITFAHFTSFSTSLEGTEYGF